MVALPDGTKGSCGLGLDIERGGNPVEGWAAVNMAMAPFLVLAGGALIWLVLKPKSATA